MKNQEQKKAAAKAAGKVTPVSGMQLCIFIFYVRTSKYHMYVGT